jgi:flagellar biogenesis protein FliO
MSPSTVEAVNSLPGAGVSVLRMFGALIFVVALFLLGAWFFQNWRRVLAKTGKTSRLQIVEGRSLGNRQALYVVGYDRQRWLIGSTQTGISVIGVLPEAPENAAPSVPTAPPFMTVLHQMLNRKP